MEDNNYLTWVRNNCRFAADPGQSQMPPLSVKQPSRGEEVQEMGQAIDEANERRLQLQQQEPAIATNDSELFKLLSDELLSQISNNLGGIEEIISHVGDPNFPMLMMAYNRSIMNSPENILAVLKSMQEFMKQLAEAKLTQDQAQPQALI